MKNEIGQVCAELLGFHVFTMHDMEEAHTLVKGFPARKWIHAENPHCHLHDEPLLSRFLVAKLLD